MYDVERKIEVEWARAAEDSFPVRIVIHTDYRPGMLNQLTSVLSAENTNIRSLEAKGATDHDGGVVEMTVDVRDKKQLEKLVATMRRNFWRPRRRAAVQLKMPVSMPVSTGPRTHRHFQIERHQDRLEGRPSQRFWTDVPARQVPLRCLYRRSRYAAAPAGSGQSVPDVQAGNEDVERGRGRWATTPSGSTERWATTAGSTRTNISAGSASVPSVGAPLNKIVKRSVCPRFQKKWRSVFGPPFDYEGVAYYNSRKLTSICASTVTGLPVLHAGLKLPLLHGFHRLFVEPEAETVGARAC